MQKPGSSQCYPLTGPDTIVTNLKSMSFNPIEVTFLFPVGVTEHWKRFSREVVESLFLGIFKAHWAVLSDLL